MDTIIKSIAEQGIQTLFQGLKLMTKNNAVNAVRDVPYGDLERQKVDVYQPVAMAPRYTVVFIHGGSWQYGNKEQYAFIGQSLARQGIACVVVNYRLYPEATFPHFVDDAAMVLAWIEKSGQYYGLNAAPLFLMGHSAGVQLALLAALDNAYAEKFKYNPERIKGVICLSGAFSFRPEKSEIFRKIFPAENSGENYVSMKPISFVQKNGTPLYIYHGRKDKTVACRSAERMYKNAILADHPVFLNVNESYGHVEPLFDFVEYWPNHKTAMKNLERFMRDHAV